MRRAGRGLSVMTADGLTDLDAGGADGTNRVPTSARPGGCYTGIAKARPIDGYGSGDRP